MQRYASKTGAYASFSGVLNTGKKLVSENFCGHVLHLDKKKKKISCQIYRKCYLDHALVFQL